MSFMSDNVLDAAAQYIIDNCDKITLSSQECANYTEANPTYALASKSSP